MMLTFFDYLNASFQKCKTQQAYHNWVLVNCIRLLNEKGPGFRTFSFKSCKLLPWYNAHDWSFFSRQNLFWFLQSDWLSYSRTCDENFCFKLQVRPLHSVPVFSISMDNRGGSRVFEKGSRHSMLATMVGQQVKF